MFSRLTNTAPVKSWSKFPPLSLESQILGLFPCYVISCSAESNLKHWKLWFFYVNVMFEGCRWRKWAQFETADWETTRSCSIFLFDVSVEAKWFKCNAPGSNEPFKSRADARTEHWTKPIFDLIWFPLPSIPPADIFTALFYRQAVQWPPFIYWLQRYLQDKNLRGSLDISHFSTCQALAVKGLWLSSD